MIDLRYPWEIADRGRAPESLGVVTGRLGVGEETIAALRARLLTDDENPHDGDATLWQAR
ncbi:hypothetical protein [Micromonospora sp. RP3T]|uniref:hypothetical protein n=1 Tax=Micromonospora sp. RP3T TaxID=2135446 RepID=UPI003D747A4C